MPTDARMDAVLRSMDKAFTGELHTLKEWDVRIIPKAVNEKLKKYRLAKTFDGSELINTDDELADTFYKSAYELALDLGFYCEDTERVIRVSEDEIRQAMAQVPKQVVFGSGEDTAIMKPRLPEDPYVPVVVAPLALMVDEKYVPHTLAGVAKYRKLVDLLNGLTIEKPMGRDMRSGTPYETWLGYYEQQLKAHALKLAGREGMAACGVANSVTEYGHLGGAFALNGYHPLNFCLLPAEMKITFANFHRAINTYNTGGILQAGGASYIGGYAGPVEGAALVTIADDILLTTILRTDMTSGCVFDINKFGNALPKALWGNSISMQATARNTPLMCDRIANTLSGPMTRDFFYENAVPLMDFCVSGAAETIAPRSAGGRYVNHISPVEAWWCGQVFKSCAGMTRAKANEIARALLPKYEAKLASPDRGRPGYECFDLETLEPIPEYRAMYKEIEKELIDLGMPLDRFSVL